MAISFVYGIFHAAGPGHGKAVISSYMLANEETWRRGITLSFASAVMQSLTAITIVGVAAMLLGATAKLMSDTVNVIETASYVLIVLLGARLLWVKGYGFFGALHDLNAERRGHANCNHTPEASCNLRLEPAQTAAGEAAHFHCHGDHHHHEEPDVLPWGHAHGPEPEQLAGPGGWRRGLSAVVAVGLRPCSGAIIVLVFALAQGLFWAGIASTFMMGLGTAITVGAVATIAVGAKAVAKRIAQQRIGRGAYSCAASSSVRPAGAGLRRSAAHRLHGERTHGAVLGGSKLAPSVGFEHRHQPYFLGNVLYDIFGKARTVGEIIRRLQRGLDHALRGIGLDDRDAGGFKLVRDIGW